jgi:molybdate transport system substrate-binding protein
MRRWLIVLALLALHTPLRAQTVFAAASLAESMADINTLWQQAGHAKLVVSLASSATLARQIEQGAQANLFASADETWADWLQQRGGLVPETRRDLLSNSLVLIVPKAQARTIAIGPGFDIAALLGPDGKLAVGDPASVPAGIYAKQALTKLGAWTAAQPRLAPADSVRSALLLVERGEVPAGIVYATDAAASPKVAVAGTFPEDSHDPITYPFAIVHGGDTPDARALLAFLATPPARAAFAKHGFIVR